MIAGLGSIDSGSLTIGGFRSETLPPVQRNVAIALQNYALYPHMSVRDNMAFGLENIGLPRADIDARVLAAAQLSGGQRQRVAIGRAIIKEPKDFLFDESLSNLNAALRVRTRVELTQLHQRMKSTMIYVTHDRIANLFNVPRHDSPSGHYREPRTAAMQAWRQVARLHAA